MHSSYLIHTHSFRPTFRSPQFCRISGTPSLSSRIRRQQQPATSTNMRFQTSGRCRLRDAIPQHAAYDFCWLVHNSLCSASSTTCITITMQIVLHERQPHTHNNRNHNNIPHTAFSISNKNEHAKQTPAPRSPEPSRNNMYSTCSRAVINIRNDTICACNIKQKKYKTTMCSFEATTATKHHTTEHREGTAGPHVWPLPHTTLATAMIFHAPVSIACMFYRSHSTTIDDDDDRRRRSTHTQST